MAKIADSSIDGELTIEVKATLTVDEDTFDTCVNIMTIYAREHGIKGMTLDFRKTAPSRLGRFLMSDEAVEDILGTKAKYRNWKKRLSHLRVRRDGSIRIIVNNRQKMAGKPMRRTRQIKIAKKRYLNYLVKQYFGGNSSES